MTTTELTPDEQAQLDQMRAELRSSGYVDIEEHGKLRPGVRVCHRGEQWSDALFDGTGVVLALTHKPDSAWSRSWGMADVELIVLRDEPRWGSRLSQLAQYHVSAAVNQPAADREETVTEDCHRCRHWTPAQRKWHHCIHCGGTGQVPAQQEENTR